MLGNKNQRSSAYNSSAIHSYLQPYQQSSSTGQSTLTTQLQQRDNNRGSLQKALSPVRNSTNKQVSSFKQNSKNQSHNSFKEDNSIGSKVGTSSSLLKNGNGIIGGGGLLDGNKQKAENSLSPCMKSNGLSKNNLLSPQLAKQSTQNLTYLLTKGKESKSVEPSINSNYLKEVQEKQNQRGLTAGRNDIYQTPQQSSKLNTTTSINTAVNGLQSHQQQQQSQLYSNSNLLSNGYTSSHNNGPFTPSSQSNNICTINLCDKQDIFKNLSLTSNTHNLYTNNSNINGNKSDVSNLQMANQSRSPTNSQQGTSNRLVIQPNISLNSTSNQDLLKQNQLSASNSAASKNYFGYIRSGSQQSSVQQKPPIGNQQSSSTDAKVIQQKTKYIDLQPTLTAQKKQSTQSQPSQQQTQIQHSYLNQSNRTDQSSGNPFNNLSNNSILVSKSSQNGYGSIVSNHPQNIITSSYESDKDFNNKKQTNPISINSVTSSKSSAQAAMQSNNFQKQDSNLQKGGVSLNLIESRNLESAGVGSDSQKRFLQQQNNESQSPTIVQLKSDYSQKSQSASPFRDSRQQSNILQELDVNSNYPCFTCKTKKAKYYIVNSDLSHLHLCSKCGIEFAQKLYPSSSNPITANSISTGIGGSAAESYLSPSKVNTTNTQILQTIDLRTDQTMILSPPQTLQNESHKKATVEEQYQFQNFLNNKGSNYINQVIPIDKKPTENDHQVSSTQNTQSSPYNYKIEGVHLESPSTYLNDLHKKQAYSNTPVQQGNFANQPNLTVSSVNLTHQPTQQNQYFENNLHTQIQNNQLNQIPKYNNLVPIDHSQINNSNLANSNLPISQALNDFKSQMAQAFNPNNNNKNQPPQQTNQNYNSQQQNGLNQISNNAQQFTNAITNNNLSNQYQSQPLQSHQEIQNQQIPQADKPFQQAQQQAAVNLENLGEDEKLKRQKLNNFQARLFKVKGEFNNLQKIFLDKNDSSIQEYHKNIESIDLIQKAMTSAMEEITSRVKEQMLNSFNEGLSKYKTSKFEVQQILNYLNCTENDLMSNLDSIIKDMDIDSLDDIIGQYDQIIQQYEEARTKKFLSQTFVVQQLKYANDTNQMSIMTQKVQDALNHLLTVVTYTQNIQRNQINTNHTLYGTADQNNKTQSYVLTQNSFLNQQPKSIYISFENRDIFQSAAHSTAEQHHPETQPQSPSFQSTLSLQAYYNQQSSQNGQQFQTFKDIINSEESGHQQKLQQQNQQGSPSSSQNGYSSYPTQSNLIISKHFYPSNGDIIQRSSFGGSDQANKQELPDSPPSIQPQAVSNYYATLANSSKQVLLTHEDEDSSSKVGIQYSSQKVGSEGFQGLLSQQPYQSLQTNATSNFSSNYHTNQNVPLQTQIQNYSSIPERKTTTDQQFLSVDSKQKRRIQSDLDQGSGEKSNRHLNHLNGGQQITNNSGNYGDKIKSEDFKGYYQKGNGEDELEVNALPSPTNKLLFRSQDNLFNKIGSFAKNHNNLTSNVSTASQNYHGGQSENHSEDFLFNQSTATTASNHNNSNHQHNFSIKNKQKYNDLLQKIQVNQSQTEKLYNDVLSSGQNFKFSQMEDPSAVSQHPIRSSIQQNLIKK